MLSLDKIGKDAIDLIAFNLQNVKLIAKLTNNYYGEEGEMQTRSKTCGRRQIVAQTGH